MAPYLLIIMFFVGLFMFYFAKGKAEKIGEWLVIAAFIGLAVASGPASILLHK